MNFINRFNEIIEDNPVSDNTPTIGNNYYSILDDVDDNHAPPDNIPDEPVHTDPLPCSPIAGVNGDENDANTMTPIVTKITKKSTKINLIILIMTPIVTKITKISTKINLIMLKMNPIILKMNPITLKMNSIILKMNLQIRNMM